MCIILYKPADANMPSQATIKTCYNNNPDGAGLLIFDNNKAKIIKGLMSYIELKREMKKQKLTNNSHFAIHFRIATSGKINQENCHPFPISKNKKTLKRLSGITSQAIMHNGIISQGEDDLSDTQVFARDTLTKLSPYLHDEQIRDHIADMICPDRMLIFSDGKIYLINNWIVDQGIYYSNESFERLKAKKNKYSIGFSNDKYAKWANDDYVEYFTDYNDAEYCEYCQSEMYNAGNSDSLICPDCGNMRDTITENREEIF